MNPRHHLHESTLMSYAAGGLPAPLSIVAGAHLEQCAHCRQRLRDAEAIGSVLLEQTQPSVSEARRASMRASMLAHLENAQPELALAANDSGTLPMPALALGGVAPVAGRASAPLAAGTEHVTRRERPEADPDHLPRSLHPYFGDSLQRLSWRWIAPGVHCIRADTMPSLIMLKIAPGKCLPMHSHGRSELTQILRGSYNDALGLFAPGDIADLDEDVEHQPVTAPGVPCICVSALDAPLVFSGWLAQKIQRFVKL